MLQSDFSLTLEGLDLDNVWKNLVIQIGHIEMEKGNSLSDQISKNERRKAIELQIAQLTKKMMSEKQPKRKRELFDQISIIRKSLDDI